MIGFVSWLTLAVAGFVCMVSMKWAPKWMDVVLVRLAGGSFIAAGAAGLTGWLGDLANGVLGWATDVTDRAGIVVFGAALVWLVVAIVGLAWIGGMLPDRLFRLDPPDWLIIAGLFLPPMVVVVPGSLGEFLRTVFTWVGDVVTQLITGLVS